MYLNFKNHAIEFDETKGVFTCSYLRLGEKVAKPFIKDACFSARGYKGGLFTPADYKKVEFKRAATLDSCELDVLYSDGPVEAPSVELRFIVDSDSLRIRNFARAFVRIEGALLWGDSPETATFGMRLSAEDQRLRAACGPSFSVHDNALFDRLSDSALEFVAPDKFKVRYDWKAGSYRFDYESGLDFGRELSFKVREELYRRKFNIPYAPIRKSHGFSTPPVGWMTWYSLQFDARESKVIANAEALSKEFGRFSDKLVVWVDWEWCHSAFDGLGEGGVDVFTPRKTAYPSGLRSLAGRIEKLGLIPALWSGASNDGRKNALLEKRPDWLLASKPEWCGQHWIDPSHPDVISEYIPSVFKRILDWGFKAVKWDCFPATFAICDQFHAKFRRPELTTDAALRDMVEAARKTLGPDVFMLSCSGETDRDICFAMDLFDAARIGGDIFGWEDFVANSVDRVFRYYPLHNVALYADADNLVLREEFNSLAQARSRVSFYGLAGLPVTLGDAFDALDEPRLEMLRRIIPVADIHPMDLQRKVKGDSCVLLDLAVCKPFGEWNVVGAMNPKDSPVDLCLNLESDLHIPTRAGQLYAVYEFWSRKFLGVFSDALHLRIAPTDSAVLRITPLPERPQLVSTSRHITQGAIDLEELSWDEAACALSGKSNCVADDPYSVAVYVTEGFVFAAAEAPLPSSTKLSEGGRLLTLEFKPKRNCSVVWRVSFSRAS